MDWIASIVVGVLSLIGAVIGTAAANSKTQALLTYRLTELEQKVSKHNQIVERTYKLEKDMSTAFLRIDDIREEIKKLENN